MREERRGCCTIDVLELDDSMLEATVEACLVWFETTG